jgi:hypothetical protein
MSTEETANSVHNYVGMIYTPYNDLGFDDQSYWSDPLMLPYDHELTHEVVVTPEQYTSFRQAQKERNNEVFRLSRDTLASAQAQAADDLANIVELSGVVFPMNKLKNYGCLLEGMRLDLSGSSHTFMSQLTNLKASIIDEATNAVSGVSTAGATATGSDPVVPTPSDPVVSAGAMQPYNTRVAMLQVDHKDDLPYAFPVNWAAHGGDGVAPRHELVASHRKSCLNQHGNKAKSNAIGCGTKVRFSQPEVTVAVAFAMNGLPAVNASSGGANLI